MRKAKAILPAVGAVALGCVLAAFVLVRVAAPVRVDGSSMEPTLHPGDVVLAVRWPARIRAVRPGEIVVADAPPGKPGSGRVIKRVWKIEGSRGSVRLVLRGDNRAASADSRTFGPLPLRSVRGVVVWRVYPRRGPLPSAPPAGPDAAAGRRR